MRSQSLLEGVSPMDEFRYGIHHFKWLKDDNHNSLIEPKELMIKEEGEWIMFNNSKNNSQKKFVETIVYRRQERFFESDSYIYKKTKTRTLKLYVDYPEDWKPEDRRPVIVWFFGGGWNVGNVLHLKPQSEYFAKRGVVGIRVDYRINIRDGVSDGGYTSTLDAKTAIRWIKKNAPLLGIDPSKLITAGASAGGHLAIASQLPNINDPQDDLSISTKACAMLLQNPYVVKANPKSWVFQLDFHSLPPMWVAYGMKDHQAYTDNPAQERTKLNGESFIKRLVAPHKVFLKEGATHGFCSSPTYLGSSTLDAAAFLQKIGILPKGEAPLPTVTMSVMQTNLNKAILQKKAKLNVPKVGVAVHKSMQSH